MGVFAKLDGLKRPPINQGNDFSFNFEEIKVTFMDPAPRAALSSAGMTQAGIAEMSNGSALSNPADRAIVALIVKAAIG